MHLISNNNNLIALFHFSRTGSIFFLHFTDKELLYNISCTFYYPYLIDNQIIITSIIIMKEGTVA